MNGEDKEKGIIEMLKASDSARHYRERLRIKKILKKAEMSALNAELRVCTLNIASLSSGQIADIFNVSVNAVIKINNDHEIITE